MTDSATTPFPSDMNSPAYSIKGLKTFKGQEQEPLAQGTLHGPAGKVADWSDDSWGGPFRLTFVSKEAEAQFVEFAKVYLAGKREYDEKPFDLAAMPASEIASTAVQEMSYEAQEEQEVRRLCKNCVVYYLPDPAQMRGRALYTWKAPYTPETVAAVRAKHPNVLEIVNERLGLPFVDAQAYRDAERIKRWQRQSKTQIIFTVRGEATGAVKEMVRKATYSPAHAADLRKKYPNLIEIANERFL